MTINIRFQKDCRQHHSHFVRSEQSFPKNRSSLLSIVLMISETLSKKISCSILAVLFRKFNSGNRAHNFSGSAATSSSLSSKTISI